MAVGFVDDRWGLNPISKLAGQVAAGAVLVWSGAQLAWLPAPGGGALILTPNESTALTILLTVLSPSTRSTSSTAWTGWPRA